MSDLDLEKTIRDCAKRGMSRVETRRMLGYTQYKMRLILDAMPDVEWPGPGASLGNRQANASRRGVPVPHLANARQARKDRCTHTVRGITGTIPQLARHFAVISYSVARTRIKDEGMTVEQAVTLPPRPSARDLPRRNRADRKEVR